ncbi:MAG: lipopolysaccharide biosynthesis protein [Thomasclavelia sp.]
MFKSLKINKESSSVLINTLFSGVVKMLSLILGLLTTPAFMNYFPNSDVLGVWLMILSILQWILYFDMGIGNGLRNKIVKPLVEKDYYELKKYISSAYFDLIKLAIIMILGITIIFGFIDFNKVFNIDASIVNQSTLRQTMIILSISIILTFILRIITSILYAMQLAFIPSLLSFITSLLLYIYVVICNCFGLNDNLINLASFYLLCSNLPLLVTTVIIFSTKLMHARPSIRYYDKKYSKAVLSIGFAFLWSQLMALILNNSNNYLITIFLGNKYVVEYQLYYKIFSIIGVFMGLLTTTIWSAVTKAKEENNYKWIKDIFKKIIALGVLAFVTNFLIIFVLQFIFDTWLGDKSILVNYFNAFFFSVMGSCLVWSSIISNFSSGLGILKIPVICLTFGAIINIPLAYFFANLLNNYIAIVIANIISYLPYLLINTIAITSYITKMEEN